MTSDSRQSMIESAVVLFRERGVEGTSFADVIEHSGAPRGSIYHHFPEGKAQLAAEATRYAADLMSAGLERALGASDPVDAVRGFIALWRQILRESGHAAGCPIVAATLEGQRSPAALDEAGAAFARWQEMLATALEQRGVDQAEAGGIATLIVAGVEGGIILARAQRDIAPLERVADQIESLLEGALTGARAR